MSTPMIIMLIVLVVLIGVCVALYFFGKKAEKKQAEQQQQMDAVAQTVSMLIIDKKKMKLKDAGLPAVVLENTPKYLRRSKVPVVKAKVGPKVMTLPLLCGVYHRRGRRHRHMAAPWCCRFPAGCGRRAAGRVHREDPHRRQAGKSGEVFAGRGVGGRHHQVRL